MESAGEAGEGNPPPEGWKKPPPGAGDRPVKRQMKSPYQLEVLEKTYAMETYPSEALRAELSVKTGLTDRQLQMWFCHRRLKDRKPQSAKRQRREEEPHPVSPPPPVLPPLSQNDVMTGSGSGGGVPSSSSFGSGESRRPIIRTGATLGKRYYDQSVMMPPAQPMLTVTELQVLSSVEAQLGEPLREDGPALGVEFDPLPPGAFGAPIDAEPAQQKQPLRSYDCKLFERHEAKAIKPSAFLPSMDHSLIASSSNGKRRSSTGNSHAVRPHMGTRALHEYQFLPEQPCSRSETYDRAPQSHFYDSSVDSPTTRAPSLPTGGQLLHGADQVTPSYTFQGQMSSSSLFSHQGRQQVYPSGSTDYDNASNFSASPNDAQYGVHQVMGIENPDQPSERRVFRDDDVSRWERKRKSDEARIAKEVEAHERRIRKELEKQDIMRRKKEEQMKKEMEKHDRERKKEEERMLREKQREEERFQREQKRENERREKFLLKESLRVEKMRQKEELRREKEAARQKAANERATARRIAREYMDLIEDERLELMELAAASKGFSSILALDSDTLQQLDFFKDMLSTFPPINIQLRKPFAIQPWTNSEENIANLLMVWKFVITFADVLGLWPFTLDEFVQSLHDYDSRLLGEIHVALLKSIIKDIEDVARIPATALGSNQNNAVNPGGGHPHIVEGAYAWGFNIRSWQHNLNYLTWPEILRQFALSAGFGPQLKKRNVEPTCLRDENEGNDSEDVITTLRNGSAAENAVALMQERGYTHRRKSRHRLTPGTVKFAAFHVLSLEGSKGLTILEVADKIQKSGLRDLTTSKTPEASIAAALSRDTKLFERTAPSTYCVRSPYRKDPADADAILSVARQKIQVFQSVLSDSEDAEKDAEDAERDEDSEGDAADDAEVDDALIESKPKKNSPLDSEHKDDSKALLSKVKVDPFYHDVAVAPQIDFDSEGKDSFIPQENSISSIPGTSQFADSTSNGQEEGNIQMGDTEIDESNFGEPWVQGLSEGDYSDLSVEERLNALVALIGVAIEGNSIRLILEERLEAASALKKQMWAEAQLDKRRFREEYSGKLQYNPSNGYKTEAAQINDIREGSQAPIDTGDRDNHGNLDSISNDQFLDQQNHINTVNMSNDRSSVAPELTNAEIVTVQQYGYAPEKSRSQLKAYIGHKAEQLYVYRSLPLGQDRKRNRYWLFSTSASPNDPGSGRIFFESRDGCWRLIDTEEAFDTLLAALDTRGIRESHLHSMLQRIETTYKEAIKRNKSCKNSEKEDLKRGSSVTNSSLDCSTEFDSPSSTLCGLSSDASEYSTSFHIDLARNNIEKDAALKRYQGFLRWMWRECYNSYILCAMKYGKKRCPELLYTCDSCFQSFLAEEKHCPSCHKSFKFFLNSEMNFSDHVTHCEQKRKSDADWKLQSTDCFVTMGIRLLKAQLAIIEVSIPAEALQAFWTDGYRKSWGVKLHSSSTAEELFQILTLLECAIKRDHLSSIYETTNELLSSTAQGNSANNVALTGSVHVLPWVPDTAAAVALRLLELDSSISYAMQPKLESQKEKLGDYMTFPSRFAVEKKTQEKEPMETDQLDYPNEGSWLDSGNGRRGRGRSNRGRVGRGRGRGSRGLRGNASSIRMEIRGDHADNFEKATRKYTRRGRSRGRGRRRGRRTARPRQRTEGLISAVEKPTTLRTFDGASSSMKQVISELSPGSSGGEDWPYEEIRQPFLENDDNNVGYQSEENGQASEEEYDYQAADYVGDDYDEGKPIEPAYDESEEEDPDVDMDGDEEMEEDDENHINNIENDIDADMYADDDEMENDADGTANVEGNTDEDEGATSYSSDEYSD